MTTVIHAQNTSKWFTYLFWSITSLYSPTFSMSVTRILEHHNSEILGKIMMITVTLYQGFCDLLLPLGPLALAFHDRL